MPAAEIGFLSFVDIIGRCETTSVSRAAIAAEVGTNFLAGLLITFSTVFCTLRVFSIFC
jgi:hypothetical protein